MTTRALPLLLTRRLPFFYGWVVLGCVCCAGFSRQGGAVATLSIFVAPMTHDFGWSRTAISGAVSLGGLLAALVGTPARPRAGPARRPRGAVLRDPADRPGQHGPVAHHVAADVLCPVLHRAHELRRAVRPWHLRRGEQLVRRPPFGDDRNRHGGADGGAGQPAADRPGRHGAWRLARRMDGGRPRGAGGRVHPGLVAAGARAGGYRPGAGPPRHAARRGNRRTAARAGLLPRRRAAHAGVLAAVAVHPVRLPGAGRREPAPGAVPHRARPVSGDRGDGGRHVLVHVRMSPAWRSVFSRVRCRCGTRWRSPRCCSLPGH